MTADEKFAKAIRLLQEAWADINPRKRLPPVPPEDAAKSFLKHVVKGEQKDDCWLWAGSVNPTGYGQFNVYGIGRKYKGHKRPLQVMTAHCFSYWLHKGRPKPGLHLAHTCDTRLCVNPAHIILRSTKEHGKEMRRKNRHAADTEASHHE